MSQEPWYADGLRFTCTQCGNCCTGAPGVVWVNAAEVVQIAETLGRPLSEVREEYTRRVGRGTSLKEHENGDCVFLDPKTRGCTIYAARPRQCRTWPFWNSNLESPEAWQSISPNCPGAGRGRLYSLDEIQERAAVIDL